MNLPLPIDEVVPEILARLREGRNLVVEAPPGAGKTTRVPGGGVVLDGFHERSLEGDLALALLRRLQRGPRPDLRLVVMSATLEAEPVARFLDAARVRSEGRRFAVAVEHAAERDERPLE